jgi:hypothetical protein
MDEPLTVEFHRSAVPGRPELHGTFHNFELSPDEQRAWLGTEPPAVSLGRPSPDTVTYELAFRRGGERRRVVLGEASVTAHLRSLIDRLEHLCASH